MPGGDENPKRALCPKFKLAKSGRESMLSISCACSYNLNDLDSDLLEVVQP
jgi:hypothetical protein